MSIYYRNSYKAITLISSNIS
uniref:Uncharacterized protein n=1 Tax=Rhizophora mucronata TaxID=61149 RepID=A0A2P2IUE3_RHIMU